jgi:hypothetical protein
MKENPRQMMGFETSADQQVKISMRDWDALRRALWRSRVGWEIVMRAASQVLQRCEHVEGCPGAFNETEPCLGVFGKDEPECPDRETRADALVILNAARMFAPTDAGRAADMPFIAPSREYYCEILSTLVVTQLQLEMLRKAGVEIPEPSPEMVPETKLPQLEARRLALPEATKENT